MNSKHISVDIARNSNHSIDSKRFYAQDTYIPLGAFAGDDKEGAPCVVKVVDMTKGFIERPAFKYYLCKKYR